MTHEASLRSRLRKVPDLVLSESALGSGDAYWVNGKEVLHFDHADTVDLRLTRAEIKARRPALRTDPRVKLRSSGSADWLEIRFTKPADVDFIVDLVEVAAAVHRPPKGQMAKPPPTGADLERRRRFH